MFEATDDHAKIVAKLDEGEKAVIVRAGDTFRSVVKQIRETAISFDLSSHRPASVDLHIGLSPLLNAAFLSFLSR